MTLEEAAEAFRVTFTDYLLRSMSSIAADSPYRKRVLSGFAVAASNGRIEVTIYRDYGYEFQPTPYPQPWRHKESGETFDMMVTRDDTHPDHQT